MEVMAAVRVEEGPESMSVNNEGGSSSIEKLSAEEAGTI